MHTRLKPSKSYQCFFVFTTDMTLEVPQIVRYYRNRWQIETVFRDVKQNFGFKNTFQQEKDTPCEKALEYNNIVQTLV